MNNKYPNERKAEIIASCQLLLYLLKQKNKSVFHLLVTLECCNNRNRNKDTTFHFLSKCVLMIWP